MSTHLRMRDGRLHALLLVVGGHVAFAVDHDKDEPHAVGVGVLLELVQIAQHGILEELVDEFDAVDVELLAGDAGQVEILPAVGTEEAAVDRPGCEGDVVHGRTGRGQGSSGCVQDRSARHGLSSVVAELMRFRMNLGVFLIFQPR